MNIAFCIDEKYIPYCGISIISLLENNTNEDITIHIVGTDISENNKNKILELARKYNAKIKFYDENILEQYDFSLYGSEYISLSTYTRLFLAEILPSNLDKVIYLDADIIINGSLLNLWKTDIENYSVLGSIDSYAFDSELYKKLGYNEEYGYINAGVLVINLKYWRENNIRNKFVNYYKDNIDKIEHHDQDIINGTLFNTKNFLPIKYNVIDHFFKRKAFIPEKYRDEARRAIENPIIIHFTTSQKPWLKGCVHPLKSEFFKYKNISPWKDLSITWSNRSFSRRFKYYKRMFLYKLKLKKHKYYNIKKSN